MLLTSNPRDLVGRPCLVALVRRVAGVLMAVWFVLNLPGWSQGAETVWPRIARVALGLGGHWKVGYPTLTRVTLENAAEEFQGWVEFETVDADGVS